jgi:hypothetical protein
VGIVKRVYWGGDGVMVEKREVISMPMGLIRAGGLVVIC